MAVKPLTPSSFRAVRSGVAVVLCCWASSSVSLACLQGYQFPPAKLLAPVQARVHVEDAVKLEPTKIDPAKLDGLFTPPPVAPEPADAVFALYVREFEARRTGRASFEDTTDYAVALVHVGRTQAAIDVLLALESRRPGIYTTAANLGTAYELSGDLEQALTWIGRGIERNSKSHDGTEWLHLAILRAKINLRADADWLKHHTVLEGSETRATVDVTRAIEYQLHERLHFVKPVDAVVCDLFYQAAVRADGETSGAKRREWLHESLRFGDWRRSEVEALLKS